MKYIMKRLLIATFYILSSVAAIANDACDMFDAELSIVQDQMKSIVEDVESCKKLTETAGEEKNKATDDKIMRLIKSAHKQSDLLSHSIVQISLRKECACEGFDFELVEQKIIEVKYWIKRAESVDLAKQKSEQYESLSSNVNKLSEVLSGFAAYVSDPCKAEKPPLPEEKEEPAEEAKESPKDTLIAQEESIVPVVQDTSVVAEKEPTEETAPLVAKDTVVTPAETSVDTNDTVKVKIEKVEEVVMDTIVAPKVTVKDTTKTLEPKIVAIVDSSKTEADTLVKPIVDTIQSVKIVIEEEVMDTVKSVDISIAEEVTPVMDTVKTTETVITEPEEIVEEEVDVPEVSTAPKVEIETPPTASEIKPVPVPNPELPSNKPASSNEQSTEFYYAVQVAAGIDNKMPSKVSSIGEDVYIYEEGGMNKFRVGHFQTLNDAVNSKNSIFKKGITDAFIVAYSNGSKIGIGEAKKIEAGSPAKSASTVTSVNKSPKKKEASKPIKSKIKNKAEVFLAVQIGASVTAADPIYELAKYEHQLQLRIKVIQGAPVRYYTGETKNKNEAEQTLSLVKSKGIDGAFLIGISNGERVDYEAALEHLGQ